ncbi:FMN reductase [Acinetobacter rudis]|uniref:FMN reductase n=1 Tax=Acinetobacter rudis TaxID=632955 RepID=A0AAW8JEY1_9GAMM|nr:FMN reductase [Acinetobacter rudis]MDQ8936234.1 FMN reductase [Acinetobacter rudis]MDQ8953948.1 FMN reductase [Acinetobacter rudis]MDQ9018497.1 FMN reductase [Acinetobacter rudis]
MSSLSSIRPLKLVAVSGAPNTPSKTESLLDAILVQLKQHIQFEVEYVKLSQIGHLLNGAASRDLLAIEVQQALTQIETADALIVASPIYRASYTGLFKHLFDYIDQFALVDKPVLLAATGGSERHALTIDHQFRPLFSFFQAQTLPIGVFATDKDFEHYKVTNQLLLERIQLATTRAVPQFLFSSKSSNNELEPKNDNNASQNDAATSQQVVLKPVERLALLA